MTNSVPPPEFSEADLQRQREAIRSSLRRTNLASVLILGVLVALASGFVWKARQSAREADRANEQAQGAFQASARAEQELWKARLNEARARRVAGGPGARLQAAAIIRELVARPDLAEDQLPALRQEAIAQLALVDVAPATNWLVKENWEPQSWDGSLTRFVRHAASGEIEVCEYPSENVLATFRGPSGRTPRASVLTPDDRLLSTRFSGSEVLVWEVKSGTLLLESRCPPVPGLTRPLVASPDSRALAMFTDQGLVIQPLETNGVARALQPGRIVLGVAFTRDASKVAVLLARERSTIEVWDTADGATVQRVDVGFPVWTFEWHPDGRRLAVSGDSGRLGLWAMNPTLADLTATNRASATGAPAPEEMLRFEAHTGAVDYTMFNPDGSCLLTHGYDKMSILWDVTSGQRLLAETRVNLRDFDRTGERMVGLVSNEMREVICTFHPRTGFRTVAWDKERRAINGVWLDPDSRLLALVHPASLSKPRGECQLWDFEHGVEIARWPGIWAQFGSDGRSLFAFELDVLRKYELTPEWRAGTTERPQSEVFLRAERGDYLNAGTVSRDGRTLAVGAINHVLLVDLQSKAVLRRFAVRTHDTELSPDGALLGTRFHNQPGCLRDPATGAVLTQMVGVVEFVFSPDNRWIVAKGTDRLRLLDPKSLAVIRDVPLELGAGFPPSIAFSPDATTLAVVHNRFEVRLMDAATGRELATFSQPHPAQVAWSHGLTFSRDGRWLVVAKEGGDVVAWDLPVIRAELAKLGLDWAVSNSRGGGALTESSEIQKTESKTAGPGPTMAASRAAAIPPAQSGIRNPAASIAFGAVALALAAGLFISLHQRRMLSAYARAEALAVEQQRKLRTAQDELLHSQKMRALGTLAAGIAHDFNNLLSVIRLSNQLAAEQTKPTGVAKENMDAIESTVAQGESIVQSMLGYSRAAAELDDEYSVGAALAETVAMLGRKFLSGIILKLEVAPDLPPVQGSRGRLEQVLLNLVINASEAMNAQGALRLAAHVVPCAEGWLLAPRTAPRYVEVLVCDSGPGIAPEALPRIFEPFFTTKNAGARPGTGLGLSTVYTMAQQDGLGLGVETAEGKGTIFHIWVPVEKPA